jgi:hypothetical protein
VEFIGRQPEIVMEKVDVVRVEQEELKEMR